MSIMITGWTLLRSVGNSRVVSLTIVIPVVGYFILFNKEVVAQLEFSRQVVTTSNATGLVSAGTLFKLFMVYFGLSFVAAGSLLYWARCPQTIKSYRDATDYIAAESEFATDRVIRRIRDEILDLGGPEFDMFDKIESALHDERNALRDHDLTNPFQKAQVDRQVFIDRIDGLLKRRSVHLTNLLRDHYDILNSSKPIWRYLSASFYFVGFVLLAIPSLQMFVQVVGSFLRLVTSH